jgi:hypothetical protein
LIKIAITITTTMIIIIITNIDSCIIKAKTVFLCIKNIYLWWMMKPIFFNGELRGLDETTMIYSSGMIRGRRMARNKVKERVTMILAAVA